MPIKDDSGQQNAGHQHPIPQNVMDVEFKVVGDLTVRQLMYLFAGAIVTYISWKSGLPTFWRVIFAFITVVLSVAVAFVPYEERGLDKWLISFLKAMTMPTQMVWRKTYSPPAYFLSDYANIIKNEIITLTPAKSRNKLDDYLGQLSETENELDKIESQRLLAIKSGFSNQANTSVVIDPPSMASAAPSLSSQSQTDVTYADDDVAVTPGRSIGGTTSDSGSDEMKPFKELQETSNIEEPKNVEPEKISEEPKQVQPKPPEPQRQPTQENKVEDIGRQQLNAPKPSTKIEQPQQANPSVSQQPKPQPAPKPQVNEERKALMKEIAKDEASSKKELMNTIELKKPTLAAPSIDRAIINIPENPKGEIKIRTTTKLPKVIVVQDIKEIESKENSLEKKVSELLDVTKQVRAEMQTASDKQAHLNKNQSRIDFFNTKYQELEQERAKITDQLDVSTNQVQQISDKGDTDLNKQVEDLSIKNEELKNQLIQIQKEISILKNAPAKQPEPKPEQPAQTVQNEAKPQPPQPKEPAQSLNKEVKQEKKAKSSAPAGTPNLIKGVVKNKSGELIDNAVVIIKDKDGDAIRALKTNQLGQFKTQTPMQNGKYTVEVIKGGMKFDIISVEAKGEEINSLSIIAYE